MKSIVRRPATVPPHPSGGRRAPRARSLLAASTDYPAGRADPGGLAEDNYLVREGVATLLGRAPEIEVVATKSDHDTLLAAVEDHEPDVVVTDIRMPPTGTDEGIRAAETLRTHSRPSAWSC